MYDFLGGKDSPDRIPSSSAKKRQGIPADKLCTPMQVISGDQRGESETNHTSDCLLLVAQRASTPTTG